MKAFSAKVFEGWITSNTVEVFTAAGLNALLGTGDELLAQVNVTEFVGASPTVVAAYYKSNDNVFFLPDPVTPNTSAIINGAVQYPVSYSGFVNGAFGRFGFKMGQASTKAYIQVFVTGRTK